MLARAGQLCTLQGGIPDQGLIPSRQQEVGHKEPTEARQL